MQLQTHCWVKHTRKNRAGLRLNLQSLGNLSVKISRIHLKAQTLCDEVRTSRKDAMTAKMGAHEVTPVHLKWIHPAPPPCDYESPPRKYTDTHTHTCILLPENRLKDGWDDCLSKTVNEEGKGLMCGSSVCLCKCSCSALILQEAIKSLVWGQFWQNLSDPSAAFVRSPDENGLFCQCVCVCLCSGLRCVALLFLC